jgi:hypothetical protein
MAFPVSLPDDGLIDVMAVPLVSESFFSFEASVSDMALVFKKGHC